MEKRGIDKIIDVNLARVNFWEFCKLTAPDFYKDDRSHLRELCDALEKLYRGELMLNGKVCRKLMINYPPQHGKSRTLVNFCKWVLGLNTNEKFIIGSYNDITATDFSKYTRDGISETRQGKDQLIYHDIFPFTKIKQGDATMQRWALEGQHFSYLGAGIGGTLTSKGGTILIIDDPVKGAEEALNETHLEKLWLWYTGTFISRVSAEFGQPLEIFNATRWSKKDPAGRLLESDEGNEWYILSKEVYKDGKMLCDDLLNFDAYTHRKNLMLHDLNTAMIFWANYHQLTVDLQGRLYQHLKTYEELPRNDQGQILGEIHNYTDTADEGECYLCSVNYLEYQRQAYILDVYYTQEPMEVTELATARMMEGVKLSKIESNNGGRGFARAVQEWCHKMDNHYTVIDWFHQGDNKNVRINTWSAWVQQNVYFPLNWGVRWPEFYQHIINFIRNGENKYKDAPDVLTGIGEMCTKEKHGSVILTQTRKNRL